MGGLAGGRNDNADVVAGGFPGEFPGYLRRAVGGVDVYLKGYAVLALSLGGFVHNGAVAVAAHDNGYFLHESYLLCPKKQNWAALPRR